MPTEDAKVNVSPEGAEPLQVRRRIIAPEGDHGHRYLIAKDILKVDCKFFTATHYMYDHNWGDDTILKGPPRGQGGIKLGLQVSCCSLLNSVCPVDLHHIDIICKNITPKQSLHSLLDKKPLSMIVVTTIIIVNNAVVDFTIDCVLNGYRHVVWTATSQARQLRAGSTERTEAFQLACQGRPTGQELRIGPLCLVLMTSRAS